jgi:hypothetical protein
LADALRPTSFYDRDSDVERIDLCIRQAAHCRRLRQSPLEFGKCGSLLIDYSAHVSVVDGTGEIFATREPFTMPVMPMKPACVMPRAAARMLRQNALWWWRYI